MKSMFFLGCFVLITNACCSQGMAETLGNLPEKVNKTSGLIFYKDKLITHNDSGNAPILFEIDTISLQIVREINIVNFPNIDWEDIDQDEEYIYIGDFGNFFGNRQNLAIYRIKKEDYDNSDTVSADRIGFNYEDQLDFTSGGRSDWDAEAFFILDTQIIVLTKQWSTKGTVAYSFPKSLGDYTAKIIGNYNVNGLVTGATRNTLGNLVLCGYSEFLEPFLVHVEGSSLNAIFGTRQTKIALEVDFAQVEGITSFGDYSYFISSEFFENESPKIILESKLFTYQFDNRTLGPIDNTLNQELIIYRATNSSFLEYDLNIKGEVLAQAIYDVSGKQLQYKEANKIETNSIDLSSFQKAVYYLTFYHENGIVSKPFFWN